MIAEHMLATRMEAWDDASQAFDPETEPVPDASTVAVDVRQSIADSMGIDGPDLDAIVNAYATAWVARAEEMAKAHAAREAALSAYDGDHWHTRCLPVGAPRDEVIPQTDFAPGNGAGGFDAPGFWENCTAECAGCGRPISFRTYVLA